MATQYQTLQFEWSVKWSNGVVRGVGNELVELAELSSASFEIFRLGPQRGTLECMPQMCWVFCVLGGGAFEYLSWVFDTSIRTSEICCMS